MTDTPETTTPDGPQDDAQPPTDASEADHTTETDTGDGGALKKLRSENKSLRERLRESEGATAALSTVVDGMRAAELRRLVSDKLADPADLTVDIASLLDDAGQLDSEKVDAAVDTLLSEKPHFAKQPERPTPPPSDRPIEGLKSGAAPDYRPTTPSWHSAIRGSL